MPPARAGYKNTGRFMRLNQFGVRQRPTSTMWKTSNNLSGHAVPLDESAWSLAVGARKRVCMLFASTFPPFVSGTRAKNPVGWNASLLLGVPSTAPLSTTLFGAARRMGINASAGSGQHVAANKTADARTRLGVIIVLAASSSSSSVRAAAGLV